MCPFSSRGVVTRRQIRHLQGVPMEPIVAILFLSGIVLTIVGSGRAINLIRVHGRLLLEDPAGSQPVPLHERPDVATLTWLAVAAYGLFLASAGILFGR